MTDDHVLDSYLACTCDVLMLVCPLDWFLACLFIIDWYLVMRFGIDIDGQIMCRFYGRPCPLHMTVCYMATLFLAWLLVVCVCGTHLYPLISELLVLVDYSSLIA